MEEFIDFIINLADEEIGDYLDGDVKHYFLNGGCYEFAKVLKNYARESRFVINKESNHCGILHLGNIYDATGKVDKKEKFHIATKEDKEYMDFRFGILEKQQVKGKRISDYLISILDQCYISDILEKVNDDKRANSKNMQDVEVDEDER